MYLGIDIGGTKTMIALADRRGNLVARSRKSSKRLEEGPEAYIAELIAHARELVAGSGFSEPIEAIGVGCGGPLDRETGVILSGSVLPGWHNVPLRRQIEDAFGVPVNLDNDATAAGFGEAVFGAGKGFRDLAYFTVSTGIGGGVIIGGKPYRGANGNAGEFGHQTLDPEGRPCACGKRGCLQAYASGTSIGERAREMAAREPTRMLELAGGRIERITAETAAEAARLGDPVAIRLWEDTGRYLGHGVSNVINLLNPQRVILGGGVTKAGELLFGPVRRYAARWTMPELFQAVEIVPAALGDDVGICGAIALAMEMS